MAQPEAESRWGGNSGTFFWPISSTRNICKPHASCLCANLQAFIIAMSLLLVSGYSAFQLFSWTRVSWQVGTKKVGFFGSILIQGSFSPPPFLFNSFLALFLEHSFSVFLSFWPHHSPFGESWWLLFNRHQWVEILQ